jgi:SAM-dependent methyltransferase
VHWKTKATLFCLFDRTPFGDRLHHFTQKRLTHTVPRPHDAYPFYNDRVERYIGAFERWGADLTKARYLEFGAGWDLFYPLSLWCCGLNSLLLLDRYSLARTDDINHTIAGLQQRPPEGATRTPKRRLSLNMHQDLKTYYGITYTAPADASHVQEPHKSIDLVSTTSTLEHVPFDDLEGTMRELARICRPNAVLVMLIDYSDHYSHGDRSLTPYNFLRYSNEEWSRFNPPIHYQNRRRHHEFRDLFRRCGFQTLEEDCTRPDDWRSLLNQQPLNCEFAAIDPSDAAITAGFFVLRPSHGTPATFCM